MGLKLVIISISLVFFSEVSAERVVLSDIKPPKELENIYVHKLNSDAYSTDFIIFIKKQVPLHKHVEHSETIYVLAGKGLLQLGNKSIEIAQGDYIRVPKGVPHGVKVLSAIPLKIISVQAPEFFGKDRVKVN